MSDGRELTGSYGTWRGQEWELWSHAPEDGTLTVVQDGGESPGADWEHLVYPNRFARTPDRFYKTVDAAEVSDVHNAHATARLGNAKVQILGRTRKAAWACRLSITCRRQRFMRLRRNGGSNPMTAILPSPGSNRIN
ncbi:hypothetical protein SAMN04489806_0015 [Paramicrobacterium humi]|uniref:Uncharacterized protein n=1 Tax=Paramicrobacterium humi TaxID=640635 RepID=A0A1H4INT4_9MICO|nr:hypothetical protein [Microbacterium humi]SEB34958.1 hypothetical protein SAMN04489806_0015 [Microbacterium humi]